jgi:hypothetical protein
MSTAKTENPTDCQNVLVRAFGAEPVEMIAATWGRGRVKVARKLGAPSISLPLRMVFRPDDSLMKKLRAAFESRNQQELDALWSEAEGFRPS